MRVSGNTPTQGHSPKLPPKTVSVTFQSDGYTVVIRQGKKAHRWQGEAHRDRLQLFCLERGFRKVERGPGLVIYRNW